jgi:hypothetical protein
VWRTTQRPKPLRSSGVPSTRSSRASC